MFKEFGIATGLGIVLGIALVAWTQPDGKGAAFEVFIAVLVTNLLWKVARLFVGTRSGPHDGSQA